MEIVLDTHTLFWFLTNNSRLSKRAKLLIEQSEQVIVPSIALMELLYILKKYGGQGGKPIEFLAALSEIRARNFIVHYCDEEVLKQSVFASNNLEMHDAMIVATASIRDAFLISKDREIKKNYPKTVW